MAFIPLPLGVRVALEFTKTGQTIVNVYHVTTTLPLVSANLTAIAAVFADWWTGDLRTSSVDDLSLDRVVATDVSIQGGQQGISTVGLPSIGSQVLDGTPNNVALVASFRTARIGRAFRGRSFFAGTPVNELIDDQAGVPFLAAFLANYLTLAPRLVPLPATWVVASYQFNGVPRVTAEATPITNVIINSRADTQRRRLPA